METERLTRKDTCVSVWGLNFGVTMGEGALPGPDGGSLINVTECHEYLATAPKSLSTV